MKRSMFLASLSPFLATCLAKAVLSPSSNQLFRKEYGGGVINVPLTDYTKNDGKTDLQWYLKVSAGTPPQDFNVLVDTGFSGLILPVSNCTTCGMQTLFDPSKSSTFSWGSEPFQDIPFGTPGGTIPASGPVNARCAFATDSVGIQGSTASNFDFVLCDEEDPLFSSQGDIDGILGFPIQADQPQGLEWALYDAGLLAEPLFGLYTPAGQITGGQMTLGGVDDTKYDGELSFIDLDALSLKQRTWAMDIQTIFIDGEQLQITTQNSSTAKVAYPQSLGVLDTGTAFLAAPTYPVARDIYARISPKIYQIDPIGTWGAPCADLDAITSELTFLFGYDGATQVNVTIAGKSLNLGPYPGKYGICQAVITHFPDGQVNDDGRGVWVIGSPLLKQYYTAWDGQDLRVGFAPLKVTSPDEPYDCGRGKSS
ncbi:hypothetical protein diail_2730 [Diaporthe ilicicola]|nr:hypothetical protein diail_2730 [Diaporthe ilicicola]